jgi:hypothetical protein
VCGNRPRRGEPCDAAADHRDVYALHDGEEGLDGFIRLTFVRASS